MKLYYAILFFLSLLMAGIYAGIWRKRFSVFITLIFAFVPIANLGYSLIAFSKTVPEAIIGTKISYIGGCYIHLFLMYSIFHLCNLNIRKWIRMLLLFLTTVAFIFVLSIGSNGIFYKDLTGEMINGNLVLKKTYGPVHTIYYIQLALYMLFTLCATFYSIKRKNDVSIHNLHYLLACEIISCFLFYSGKFLGIKIDLIPLAYTVCESVLLIISRRIVLYDVTETVIDTIALNGKTGFVSFDDGFNYLGSNQIAKDIFPELTKLKVDESAVKHPELNKEIIENIRKYIINPQKNSFFKSFGDQIFQVDINKLFDGRINRGYILYMQDDTKDQKYISLLNGFNDKLRDEVAQKTAHIVEMHEYGNYGRKS